MSYTSQGLVQRFSFGGRARAPVKAGRDVVIRAARDADEPLLRDLAQLDSARPLDGPVLVAFVDGRPWAAHGLDDDRVVADPFVPSAQAVGLLALRVRQLRAAHARSLPRRASRRVVRLTPARRQ